VALLEVNNLTKHFGGIAHTEWSYAWKEKMVDAEAVGDVVLH